MLSFSLFNSLISNFSVYILPTISIVNSSAGSVSDAFLWGIITSASLPLSAWLGMQFLPGKKIISKLLAFAGGVLIGLISYELLESSYQIGGISPTFIGLTIGLLIYVISNRWIENKGIKERRSCEHGGCKDNKCDQSISITSQALVLGALIDGIPESASIGISLLDNKMLSASVFLGVIIANFPEGLASGAGLRRSGISRSRILLIWSGVAFICTITSVLSFLLLADLSPYFQAIIFSIAGGGILAMTLQTVIPEAYKDAHDLVSIFGSFGFAVAFFLSHGSPFIHN